MSPPEPVAPPVAQTTRWTTRQGLPGDMVRALSWHDGQIIGAGLRGPQTVGLFALRDDTIHPLSAPTTARIRALRTIGGQRVAGAEDGLWVQSSGQWQSLSTAPVQALYPHAQGALVLAGDARAPTLYALQDGALSPLAEAPCVEPVTVLPMSDRRFWLVCREAIFYGASDQDAPRPYDLASSALWQPTEDGTAPPVYLYDAALGPDQTLYVVGKTHALVRVTADRIETVETGDFATVNASERGLFLSTFDGGLHRWSPDGGLQSVIPAGGARIDAVEVDDEARLFVIIAPRDQPHRLERWLPPYAAPDRVWSLAVDQSLSPGVVAILPDQQGGALLETNRGLWHLQ